MGKKLNSKKFAVYTICFYVSLSLLTWYILKINPYTAPKLLMQIALFHFLSFRKLAVLLFFPIFYAFYASTLLMFKEERNALLFITIAVIWFFLLYDAAFVKYIDIGTYTIASETHSYENWKISDNLLPAISFRGVELILGENCDTPSWMEREVMFPSLAKGLEIYACTAYSGGDGTRADVYVDNEKGSILIPSNSCNKASFNISDFAKSKIHSIRLVASTYGICNNESQIIKYVGFELSGGSSLMPENSDFDFTDINDYLSWQINGSNGALPYYDHNTNSGVELHFGPLLQ